MLCVVSFFRGDREQAVRWSEWVNELGPYPTHDLLIVRDHRAEPIPHLGKSFRAVSEIVIRDDAYDSWPESPNLMYRRAAKHIEYGTREPWLWLEVDTAPLKEGWLDAIEAEYKEAVARGKHFLGDFVHVPEMMGVPDHCSGVAVYPGILSHFAGTAYLAHETAWDVVAAGQIVPQMHKSKLILHRWKHASFDTWEQVEQRIFAVNPEAVLFHADKTSSLIDLLRQQKNLPVSRMMDLTPADDGAAEIKTESNSESASTATSPVVEWTIFEQDALFSEVTVRSLAEQLKGFMGNSVTTRRVRNVLHEVGVIELPYRFKRRKGWKRKKAKGAEPTINRTALSQE